MDVLDECPDLAQRCSLARRPASEALLTDLVPREGLLEDRHEGAVAGQEHAVELILVVDVLRGRVKADQCLARSGNPGDEADGLL